MHILISPNAFKNSLTAAAAAMAIEKGFRDSNLYCTTQCFPIGDGGDGTGQLVTRLCGGETHTETVRGPLGRKIQATMGMIEEGRTAVIEMAAASGLRLLDNNEYDPLHATSYGTGELMVKALDRGARKIILCVGGSATVDGGCGILQALGVRFLDTRGNDLFGIPENLWALGRLDASRMDKRMLATECTILCDVSNTLLGNKGAAHVFGPQKGASEKDVALLEKALQQFSNVTSLSIGRDMSLMQYGGAAGGTAAGLSAWLNAELVNGIDAFLKITCFDEALKKADLLVTGEGSLDAQTLDGKGPYGVAKRAKELGVPAIAFAGNVSAAATKELAEFFTEIFPINKSEIDLPTALLATAKNLTRTARETGDQFARTGKWEKEN